MHLILETGRYIYKTHVVQIQNNVTSLTHYLLPLTILLTAKISYNVIMVCKIEFIQRQIKYLKKMTHFTSCGQNELCNDDLLSKTNCLTPFSRWHSFHYQTMLPGCAIVTSWQDCNCVRSIHWSQLSSPYRSCIWRSADRWHSIYIWVTNKLIFY